MKVRNPEDTSTATILSQMGESRPLPMGRTDFDEWSDRIISGAIVDADIKSQKFVLANMLLHLGPTESHKPDAYFIHTLRKNAVNQVALTMIQEIKNEAKAAEEAAKTPEQTQVEETAEATLRRIGDRKAK